MISVESNHLDLGVEGMSAVRTRPARISGFDRHDSYGPARTGTDRRGPRTDWHRTGPDRQVV